MLKAQGKIKFTWDLMIIVFSIYQAFTIPIQLSFDPDYFNVPLFRAIDSLLDLVFITDIIFRFRTTYIDPISGEEQIDANTIALQYLFSLQFVIDVLSSISFDTFFSGPASRYLRFLGILKGLRIFRIS